MSQKPAANIQAVLFDLDGTLMDTAPDFYTTLHVLRRRYQQPELDEEIIRNQVSDGSRALTRLAFPELDEDVSEFERRRKELLDVYAEHAGLKTILFPEIEPILSSLDTGELPWGIVTNKPRLYTELILERTGLASTCAVLVCADDLEKAKPDPEGILKACAALGIDSTNTLYVGDHERDIIAGKAAGCTTACVSFGYFHNDEDIQAWGADFILENDNCLIVSAENKTLRFVNRPHS